jgi:hypothetical protein
MTPNTYELAKRVEKIAPELGVCATTEHTAQWISAGYQKLLSESNDARLLLLGVLQEWADGEGYTATIYPLGSGFTCWPSLEDGSPIAENVTNRLEALVLCLEHSKARDSETISSND